MLELPVLLAENGLHNYLGLGWAAGAVVVGVAATMAVMKYRQGASESKDKEQDLHISNVSEAVNNIPKLLTASTESIRDRLDESEARFGTGLRSLEKTITKKVDSIKDDLAKQSTRMAVVETELGHLKKSSE